MIEDEKEDVEPDDPIADASGSGIRFAKQLHKLSRGQRMICNRTRPTDANYAKRLRSLIAHNSLPALCIDGFLTAVAHQLTNRPENEVARQDDDSADLALDSLSVLKGFKKLEHLGQSKNHPVFNRWRKCTSDAIKSDTSLLRIFPDGCLCYVHPQQDDRLVLLCGDNIHDVRRFLDSFETEDIREYMNYGRYFKDPLTPRIVLQQLKDPTVPQVFGEIPDLSNNLTYFFQSPIAEKLRSPVLGPQPEEVGEKRTTSKDVNVDYTYGGRYKIE